MNNRNIKLMLLDAFASVFTLYFSFIIRFEFQIPDSIFVLMLSWLPWFVLVQIVVFYFSGLYDRLWRYTSLFDLYAILRSVAFSTAISSLGIFIQFGLTGYSRSVLILYLILNSIIVSSVRISVRIYYSHYHKDSVLKNPVGLKTLLLIGAGKTGDKIAREILTSSRDKYRIAGFVDDDLEKAGGLLHGIKIFSNVNSLPELKIHYDEILITAPSSSGDQMRHIVDACKQTGKRYKTVPALNELLDREISLAAIRDVSYSDLLGREEVKLDMNSIEELLHGKRILITGAGGSIGSELVRQCLAFEPSEIICFDISEENIYKLEHSTSKIRFNTIIKMVLGSVNHIKEVERLFLENRPHIVFHAAAYKHVPIQELHPWTAVKTNIGGTLNVVKLSDKYSVNKFVLVSTDKAVNPVNVMGATKRTAEKMIQSFNFHSKTCFMSVRFGNVLGSSGSAIPTFQKQINEGGPLTITHPEMTRYFMSIQEASQLILQCGSFGKDGEIFLLQMGKPIKIVQMAHDLIRLSGLEPDVDIPIVYTGLRPGEKLYEELQMHDERIVPTGHRKIMILKEGKNFLQWRTFEEVLKTLIIAAEEINSDKIQLLLRQIIPSYQSQSFQPIEKSVSYGIKGEA